MLPKSVRQLTIFLPLWSESLPCERKKWQKHVSVGGRNTVPETAAANGMRLSQDILDLGDDVFGVRALSLQGHAVPHPLLVQPGQLHLSHRQAHAALLPASTKAATHTEFTLETATEKSASLRLI